MPIGKGNIIHKAGVNAPQTATQRLYAEAELLSVVGEKPFDSLEFILAFESGELNEEQLVAGFQQLIDSGLAWALQGMYGRMAMRLIEGGYCHAKRSK